MDYKSHTFAILAYKESAYLEDCIQSILNQTIKSEIIVCTSTPNSHIELLVKKYNLNLFINNFGGSIAKDWNFALQCCKTKFVTLAHQDDIYFENYLATSSQFFNKNPCIIFTNYTEIKNGAISPNGPLLVIKSILLWPFFFTSEIKKKFFKKSILALGSPICCPSVTYNMYLLRDFRFNENLVVSLDWDSWINLANTDMGFIYISKKLMSHRIHKGSETTKQISTNIRSLEDKILLEKIWGKFSGRIIAKLYSMSYRLNK